MPLVATHSSGIFHAMHIYTHPEFIHHDVAEGHPERPDRLRHLLDHLDREGILDDCQLREPSDLNDAQILAAHTAEHLEFLRRSEPTDGIVPLDPDTWMGTRSLQRGTTCGKRRMQRRGRCCGRHRATCFLRGTAARTSC